MTNSINNTLGHKAIPSKIGPEILEHPDLNFLVFDYCVPKTLVGFKGVNTFFKANVPVLCREKLKGLLERKSVTYDDLKTYQKVLGLASIAAVLQVYPDLSKEITALNLAGSRITDKEFREILVLCPKLQALNLRWCYNIEEETFFFLAERLPHLTSIDLQDCPLTRPGLRAIASHCRGLLDINLKEQVCVDDEEIIFLAQNCPNLRKINVEFCYGLTDAAITALARPSLREINFSRCSMITRNSLLALAENCPDLTSIDLTGFFADADILNLADHCPRLITLKLWGKNNKRILDLLRRCPNLQHMDQDNQWTCTRFRKELSYKPASYLGQLYVAELQGKSKEELCALFQKVEEQLGASELLKNLKKVYFHILKAETEEALNEGFTEDPLPGDLDKGVVDDWITLEDRMRRSYPLEGAYNFRMAALESSILHSFFSISKSDRDRVYKSVYSLAGSPETKKRFGLMEARDSLARLADALLTL